MKEQNQQMEKVTRIVLMAAVSALALILVSVVVFLTNYVLLDGKVYSRKMVILNLSGSDMEDFSALRKLKRLEKVDLTHTSLTDLSVLDDCHSIRFVVMKDKTVPAERCVAFYKAHPDAQLISKVEIADRTFAFDTEELAIADITHEELRQLAVLRNLKKLDVSFCQVSDEDYDYLKKHLPECDILRILSFDEKDYGSEVETIKLSKNISDQELERVRYFPHLKEIDATTFTDLEAIEVLKEKFPQYRIKWSFQVMGVKTYSTVETLDLRGKKVTLDQVREALTSSKMAYFYDLKAVDLCGCGLTNAQMEDLERQFSDLKFIWNVYVRGVPVRTDVKVFSTMYSSLKYSENDLAPVFKYCTELVALDLSNNRIQELKGIGNLKQLRALTVTHNPLRKFPELKQLSNLEYLEADDTYVTNISCLTDLQNLKYVNLYGRIGSGLWVKDISPLENHSQLSLAVFDSTVSEGARNNFFRSNPDCTAEFSAFMKDNALYNKTWNENPYRKALYQAYRKWDKVTDYDPVGEEFVFATETQ